jgi:DNA-binding PadR family transcriptional regulator
MKLPSGKERVVLELLAGANEMYGLEMVRATSELKRGTIYVLLDRMEEQKLVSSRHVEDPTIGGMPRRLYRITGLGQRSLAAARSASAILSGDSPLPVAGWCMS